MFVHGDSPYLREVPAPSDQAAQSGVQMLPGETALTLWLPSPGDSARRTVPVELTLGTTRSLPPALPRCRTVHPPLLCCAPTLLLLLLPRLSSAVVFTLSLGLLEPLSVPRIRAEHSRLTAEPHGLFFQPRPTRSTPAGRSGPRGWCSCTRPCFARQRSRMINAARLVRPAAAAAAAMLCCVPMPPPPPPPLCRVRFCSP